MHGASHVSTPKPRGLAWELRGTSHHQWNMQGIATESNHQPLKSTDGFLKPEGSAAVVSHLKSTILSTYGPQQQLKEGVCVIHPVSHHRPDRQLIPPLCNLSGYLKDLAQKMRVNTTSSKLVSPTGDWSVQPTACARKSAELAARSVAKGTTPLRGGACRGQVASCNPRHVQPGARAWPRAIRRPARLSHNGEHVKGLSLPTRQRCTDRPGRALKTVAYW